MKKSNRWLWVGMIMLFVALLAAGCSSQGGGGDGAGDEPGVPAGITLSAINMSVAIDGMITITATVTDSDGNDVADATSVTLSLNSGSGEVTITPSSQQTIDGRATFIVTGAAAGIVNLIAQAGGAMATITITVVDTAPQITLTADDTTVLVGRTVVITATVTESNGNLVPDDTEIHFDVSDTTLAEVSEAYPTTLNGVATVVFTAKQKGTVLVSATYGVGTGTIEMIVADQTASPPATITLSTSAANVQLGRTATITATVRDANGLAVADGTGVQFSVGSDAGSVSPTSSPTTGGAGRATTTFTAEKYGATTVTATAGSVTGLISINVTANVTYMSVSTSKPSVKTDNLDNALITATALDADRVPLEGIPIGFSATAGQISTATTDTDASGNAKIQFTSGAYDKRNQTVTITATAPPNRTASVPVQLTGTTITLAIDNTSLQGAPNASNTSLTATVKDGGGIAIFDTEIAITQASDGSASVLLQEEGAAGAGTTTLDVDTDVAGKAFITVTGNNSGAEPVVLNVSGLGYTATQNIIVSGLAFELLKEVSAGPLDVFAFTDANPDTITRSDGGSFVSAGFEAGDLIAVSGSASNDGNYTVDTVAANMLTLIAADALTPEIAGNTVTIRLQTAEYVPANTMLAAATSSTVYLGVRSPDGNNVRISTSLGTLNPGASSVITVTPNAAGIAAFTLDTPAFAGVASILAEDSTNASVNDSLKIAVAAPSSSAANISIQASPTVVPVSSGGTINVSTLKVTVTNPTGEVVNGAPVVLRLGNDTTTGGGEYIAPALVYTNTFGQAEATFYAGSLPSTSEGVDCIAELVINPAVTDTIAVVIGGNASSVAIGAPTEFEAYSPSLYLKPMSVMVSDSNGNPVNGVTVNLSVWPLGYYTGWIDNTLGPVFCCSSSYYPNEDVDRNEVLDPAEDQGPYPGQFDPIFDCNPCPCNINGTGNGVLDPPKSSAGSVPASVVTGENGVAEFDFFQQKIYSVWTKVEIKASVVVYGTETISVLQYGPNWLENEKLNLPSSPWGGCSDVCGNVRLCP